MAEPQFILSVSKAGGLFCYTALLLNMLYQQLLLHLTTRITKSTLLQQFTMTNFLLISFLKLLLKYHILIEKSVCVYA